MVSIDYAAGQGWHDAEGAARTGPSNSTRRRWCCTTRQEIFEGLKAYRWADGSIVSFRPEANAARLRSSARRLAIPELPDELFLESLRQLIAVDQTWVPAAGGEESLYLRPFIFATEPGLGVRPADEYRYLVIGSPAGAYFPRGVKPVSVWLSHEYVRAVTRRHRRGQVRRQLRRVAAGPGAGRRPRMRPGGVAGRDRAPLRRGDGRHEPVLRVRQRRLRRALVTPGAVRFAAAGYHPGFVAAVGHRRRVRGRGTQDRRRRVAEEGRRGRDHRGVRVRHRGGDHPGRPRQVRPTGEFTIADGEPGEVTMALRDTLTGIQRGTFADTHGWMTRLAELSRPPGRPPRRSW